MGQDGTLTQQRKARTGWHKEVAGFRVERAFIRRTPDGYYDVLIDLKTGTSGGFDFGNLFGGSEKAYRNRICTGIETRKEAERLAKLAIEELLAILGHQLTEWSSRNLGTLNG